MSVPAGFVARPAQLRDPEVEDLHQTVLGEEQVLRLQVAMDDAFLVGGAQAPGDLDRGPPATAHAQGARGHAVAEGLALQQLRDDVGRPPARAGRFELPGVVDGDDVGVVQDARPPGLLHEAADPLGVWEPPSPRGGP